MLLTPHTVVGIALGTSLHGPLVVASVSFGCHFLGDLVPHWDFYSNTKKEERQKGWRPIAVMFDLVVAVALGLTAVLYALWVLHDPHLALNIFLGGVFAVLPDALEAPHIFMSNEPKILEAITNVQRKLQVQAPLPWGALTQFLVILVCSLWISRSLGL